MTIRPVDLQTIIPKLPEIQKAKNAENGLEKNNLNINIHKEQQQQEKNTRQVVEAKKPHEARINRDGQQKKRQGKQEKQSREDQTKENDGNDKEDKGKYLSKIDIRI
ncbi:MAG TPA: hypothetical protein PLL98_01520 [Bacillota bacterium]|nr:hypothetical protein [Bacillota bacterium]HOR85141.1 hypothetical protein [Bacillota bacterium]HPL52801.1 hypothetical protein [Bacillota bacterium]